MSARLRLACLDAEAPPLFSLWSPDRGRHGYEPTVAALLGDELGRAVEWVRVPWVEMIPTVQRGDADAVLCGQGITDARREQVDFTRPYAVFHESVLMRRDEQVNAASGLTGRRVAAIEGSTNMALAETFPGVAVVPFGSGSDDVYGDMLAALKSGKVDAVVDDDVVFVPLGESNPDFALAFTVRTGNRWGIGVAKDRTELREELDAALGRITADGRLRTAWKQWLPTLDYPFEEG